MGGGKEDQEVKGRRREPIEDDLERVTEGRRLNPSQVMNTK